MILEYKNVNGSLVKITDAERIELEAEAQRIEVIKGEEIAKEEAREAVRASALQKLVENAGLTVEEVKSFINIEE